MTKENRSATYMDISLGLAHLVLWIMFLFGVGHFVGMLIGQYVSDAAEDRLANLSAEYQTNRMLAAKWAYELEGAVKSMQP